MSRISIGEIAGRKMALAPPAGRYPHSFLSIEAGSRPDCLQVGGMVKICLQCAYKSQRQRKRESQLAPQLPDISWLGDRDSNPDKRSQSPRIIGFICVDPPCLKPFFYTVKQYVAHIFAKR